MQRLKISLMNGRQKEESLWKVKFVLPQIHRACLLPLNSNLEKYFKIHLTFDFSEAYLEPSKRSKMELFAKIVNGFRSIPVSAKSSIFDVWLGS